VGRQGGAAICIDYGHDRGSAGDTLQAVKGHKHADPWLDPGDCDLTAHVDFEALARAAAASGVSVHGPVGQGDWLVRLGIDARAETLARAYPHRREELATARDRLVRDDQMGRLFRVLGLSAPDWPAPEGF
jgi:SAM-dependent MidA family methyltransferase